MSEHCFKRIRPTSGLPLSSCSLTMQELLVNPETRLKLLAVQIPVKILQKSVEGIQVADVWIHSSLVTLCWDQGTSIDFWYQLTTGCGELSGFWVNAEVFFVQATETTVQQKNLGNVRDVLGPRERGWIMIEPYSSSDGPCHLIAC